MHEKKRIIVLGAGGHARSVCDILEQSGAYRIVGLIAAEPSEGFWGLPVLGDDSCLEELFQARQAEYAFAAIGSNKVRERVMMLLQQIGYKHINAISPQALISPHATLGEGIAVMPGAIIGPDATIGDGTIVNTNASVDHDDKIGAFCHIAPGVVICGTTTIGEGSMIGAGAKVIDGLTIGAWSMVGAGAAVVSNLPDHCTAVGIPARVIKEHGRNEGSNLHGR